MTSEPRVDLRRRMDQPEAACIVRCKLTGLTTGALTTGSICVGGGAVTRNLTIDPCRWGSTWAGGNQLAIADRLAKHELDPQILSGTDR